MIKKLIFKNLWVKLFCLFSATALWLYVSSTQSNIGKFPGSINIKAINTPANLVAIFDQKTVDIKIAADPLIWRKLSSDSFSAYIDLATYEEGTFDIQLTVASSVPDVQIIQKNPEKILVSLEPIITKDVPVSARLEGEAAKGLVAGSVEIKPAHVQVRGPKSLIGSISEATALVKLNGEVENFSKNIEVIALNDNGELVKDVDFTPSEVSASIPIVKASNNKTVGVKVSLTGTVKSGYTVSKINVEPSVVNITGSSNVLSDINYVETAEIDVSNLDANLEKQVNLVIPSGLAMQSGVSSKVRVTIVLDQLKVQREISVTNFDYQNAGKFNVSSITPEEIKLIASVPIGLANLDGISLKLDFAGKKVDQNNSISFILNEEMFILPEGVSIIKIIPETVRTTVE